MSSYVDAIKSRLTPDAQLIARLATWEFTTGIPTPSIHTTAPAPFSAAQPLITIESEASADDSIRDSADSKISFTVTLWGDKGESDRDLNELAYRVYRLLTGKDLTTIEGEVLHVLNVLAPQKTTDANGFPGFIVIVNGRISESLIK